MGRFEHSEMDGTETREVSFGEATDMESLDKPYEVQEPEERPQLTLEQKEEIRKKTQWSHQVVEAMAPWRNLRFMKRQALGKSRWEKKPAW